MPERTRAPDLVRVVEGIRSHVPMFLELIIRCDYGSIEPWVQSIEGGIWAIAGPDSFLFRTNVPLRGENGACVADFLVSAGQRVGFTLTWHPSHEPIPPLRDTGEALKDTEEWWRQWSGRCTYTGPWREEVLRSLITLKALTYAPTGGIVAAATTSLPEQLRGVRNWDYRYCWLRDSTFTLLALLNAGYREEAQAWRQWLLRAVAGKPAATNIMYGLAGERRLTELELEWLPGYDGARPVRIGNAASRQLQLDIYGEVLDVMYQSRRFGLSRRKRVGASKRPWSPSSRRRGSARTRASGRCAARGGTSPTPRSWPGSPWTGPSRRWSTFTWKDRSSAGACCATRSTGRSAARDSIPTCTPSSSRTGRRSWTPAY